MKRSNFIKFISLSTLFSPNLFLSAKSSNPRFEESLLNYTLLPSLEAFGFTEDDVDGVVLKKINEKYYLFKPTIVDIADFGVVGDGKTDDSKSIQDAFNSCIKLKKTLYVSRPTLSYFSLKSIKICGQIRVFGDGLSLCGFNFYNCNGFEILEGVTNVIFEKVSINQAIRYIYKPNNFIAFNFLGSDTKRPYTNTFRDVFIDGFQTAFRLAWVWDSLFENVKVIYGQIGFNIVGLSVNNIISNSSISVEGSGSKAIYFSDKVSPTEGWRITNLLTFGAEIAIHAYYTSNIYVTTPILDFCGLRAVLLEDGTGPSANWQILGGYIAMSNNSDAAIEIITEKDNSQIRGNKFTDLDILAYNGKVLKKAFNLVGKHNITQLNNITISNINTLK